MSVNGKSVSGEYATMKDWCTDTCNNVDIIPILTVCLVTECVDGYHGQDCSERCGHCVNDACDKGTGHCPRECLSGYQHPDCKNSELVEYFIRDSITQGEM